MNYNIKIFILLTIFILIVYHFNTYFICENFNNIINNSNKIKFITFGAGGKDYYDAVERLTSQTKKLNLFDEIIGYKDNYLKEDKEFWKKHSSFILNNKRGYGYWLWKPYLIMKTLEKMNDNDILIYADSGCEIDINQKDKFIELFQLVKKDLIIGSFACDGTCKEKEWTKMDLFTYLNMNNEKYLNSIQHQASALCILKCDKTYNLIKEWYNISCNYNLLDDSTNIYINDYTFREHRHDQSIFSLLTKKYNIYSKETIEKAITIARNRTGNSKLLEQVIQKY